MLRRFSHGIYPPILAERGLEAALESHVRLLPLPVEVRPAGSLPRLPQQTESAVYFCVLEALQNSVAVTALGRCELSAGPTRRPSAYVPTIPPTGSIRGMARQKVTITMDREKAAIARELAGAASTSEVVDIALDSFIARERLRHDIDAYRRRPQTSEELRLADQGPGGDLDDETDWELLYGDVE